MSSWIVSLTRSRDDPPSHTKRRGWYKRNERNERLSEWEKINSEGIASQSPGLVLRLPWVERKELFQPQRGCVISDCEHRSQPLWGCNLRQTISQGCSKRATLGFG